MENNIDVDKELERLYKLDKTIKRRTGIFIGSLVPLITLGTLIYSAKTENELHYYGWLLLPTVLSNVITTFNLFPRNEEESRLERKLDKLKYEGKWLPPYGK